MKKTFLFITIRPEFLINLRIKSLINGKYLNDQLEFENTVIAIRLKLVYKSDLNELQLINS